MSSQLLELVSIFGTAVVIAMLGYSIMMQGRALIQPEQRQQLGSQLIYTGLALLFIGLLIGVIVLIIAVVKR